MIDTRTRLSHKLLLVFNILDIPIYIIFYICVHALSYKYVVSYTFILLNEQVYSCRLFFVQLKSCGKRLQYNILNIDFNVFKIFKIVLIHNIAILYLLQFYTGQLKILNSIIFVYAIILMVLTTINYERELKDIPICNNLIQIIYKIHAIKINIFVNCWYLNSCFSLRLGKLGTVGKFEK